MEDIIKLKSKYKVNNYLKRLAKPDNSESKTYLLKTEEYTVRAGELPRNNKFIEPIGGPIIVEGEILEEANTVVKSIDFVMGYGWTITFC